MKWACRVTAMFNLSRLTPFGDDELWILVFEWRW